VSTDERPESLAAQAASWVPPWERPPRLPDPAFAAAEHDLNVSDDLPGEPPDAADGAEGADTDADGAGTPELPPLPGEASGPVTVDAPQPLPGEHEPAPTEVELDDVPIDVPAIDDAPDDDDLPAGGAAPVDAPAPVDGEDAGTVFDTAADDDVSDDGDVDLPATEPGEIDAPAAEADGDEPKAEDTTPNGAKRQKSGIPAQGRGKGDKGAAAGAAGRRTPERSKPEPDVAAAGPRPGDEEPLPPIDDAELRAALEAILLVVDEPVGELQLAQIMEQPVERVGAMLEDISATFTAAGHGFDLRRAAGGWRLYTRPEYAPYVERFVLDGQSTRLTQAALETLAVVAYKQPVTRSRISAIRGVNCDGVMRTLVTRGLIEECGAESETGAFLYRTTVLFLEKLGLNSVDQLPALAPFLPDDVEEVFDAQR
jgi:segregation and condensation protein B